MDEGIWKLDIMDGWMDGQMEEKIRYNDEWMDGWEILI